ncbi:MAG TPA: hypothetical protein VF017_19030 [Thermoanaerobaculia bacterium]|nr:hypothetical protein [Thermoanaerobaculia bacterium]
MIRSRARSKELLDEWTALSASLGNNLADKQELAELMIDLLRDLLGRDEEEGAGGTSSGHDGEESPEQTAVALMRSLSEQISAVVQPEQRSA